MKSISRMFAVVVLTAFGTVSLSSAAGIDMKDPHRALAREGDIRIDAQLVRPEVAPGATIAVTYQVQNLSNAPIAIAARRAEATYDKETRTITFAIGAEVPSDGNMPEMTTIEPGKTKLLRAAAVPMLAASVRSADRGAFPRYVQVKVTVMRELTPFETLIRSQAAGRQTTVRLSDELFERWFEANDTIFLNTIPVQWSPGAAASDVERRRF